MVSSNPSYTKNIGKHVIMISLSLISIVIIAFIFITPIGGLFPLQKLLNLQGFINLDPDHPVKSTYLVNDITEDITIIRDIWGVPHIYSKYDKDVYFGLGVCHAQDRLFQMDIISRTGMGLMSEILGNTSLEDDIFYQKIGILDAAGKILEKIELERETDPLINKILIGIESYCKGVNFIINKQLRSNSLALEF